MTKLALIVRRAAPVLGGATAAALLGCSDPESGRSGGGRSRADRGVGVEARARARTLIIAATAEPRSLLPPFAADVVGGQLCDQLYQRLAEPRHDYTSLAPDQYEPVLARAWSWGPDSLSLRFELDPAARWHDGRPVTSRDVVATYRVYTDSTSGALRGPAPGLLDSVRSAGPHAVVLWLRRRTTSTFHQVVYPVHVLPAHLLEKVPTSELAAHSLNRAPIGSGAFRFVRWLPGVRIELAAVATQGGSVERVEGGAAGPVRVPLERLVLRVFEGPEAAVSALAAGDVDVVDFVRPEDASQLRTSRRVTLRELPALSYGVLQWNLRAPRADAPHPVLGERAVREALALAVNRRALVANLFAAAGREALGPVTRAQVTADTTLPLPPFDPDSARRLLDRAGWRMASDGVRRRGRRVLAFTMLVPRTSAPRRRAAVILQEMFRAVGAAASVEALDNAAMIEALRRGQFDGALMTFRVDPDPSGIADVWGGAAAASGDGFNFGRYASAEADRRLSLASAALTPVEQRAAYRDVYEQVLDDHPGVFLYEPPLLLAHAVRLRPVGLRPDAWWARLRTWTAELP